jgi:2-polyprenyl-3-methyl-5-hydroxy-6-metoxy-1,4-benzoquinol methylase
MTVLVGNVYDKFGSRNPLVRRLMRGFLQTVERNVERARPTSILEVGCGEGQLIGHLKQRFADVPRYAACDLSLDKLKPALTPGIEFKVASVYDLPYASRSFDLVVCCEVLEHLEEPSRALKELCRVSAHYLLVSTPEEPLWRALNLLRLAYWADWGNTPGHLQHFSRKSLEDLLSSEATILEISTPLPWIVALSEPKAAG